jgi:hypothetical protein
MIAARLRAALIAAAAGWAVLLVAVPFLASRAHASPLASALILGVYALGSVVCHQLPERSYHLWAAQMPVCARCAGIYFGAVAGAIAGTFRTAEAMRHGGTKLRTAEAVRHNSPEAAQGFSPARAEQVARGFSPAPAADVAQRFPPPLRDGEARRSAERGGGSPAGRVRLALALAVTPTLLTLVYEWTTGIMPAHAIRAAAGVPIGLVVAWLLVAAAENQVN